MATIAIDTSLLTVIRPIFTFLLVLTILYGLFAYTKLFGDNKVIHAFIAFIIAVFATFFSETSVGIIEYLVPKFTVLFIVIIMVMIAYKIFGATDADFAKVIRTHGGIQWTIAIIVIVIAIGALSHVFGAAALGQEGSGDNGTGSEDQSPTTIDADDSDGDSSETTSGSAEFRKTDTDDFQTNVKNTFYHPKVIGTLFILLVATFAVRLLSNPAVK